MTDQQLIKTAKGFRKGLLNKRSVKDMCMIVSNPLATLLRTCHVPCELLEVGIIQKGELHSHYCIKLLDGRVLDPTASQFTDPDGNRMPDIYLGQRPAWYQKIRNSRHSEVKKTKRKAI